LDSNFTPHRTALLVVHGIHSVAPHGLFVGCLSD
jgi:hypothetical protein